jgi:hypothetical protein
MNCLPGTGIGILAGIPQLAFRTALGVSLLVLAAGCALAQTAEERIYDAIYTVRPVPAARTAEIELAVGQSQAFLRELSMDAPAAQFSDFSGDGEISRSGSTVSWRPPAAGGVLRWTAKVRHLRNGDSYDAWIEDDWALLRASDVMPPARTRTLKGASSRTWLRFQLPGGWSALTQYRESGGRYRVSNEGRRFDRPTGWILLGKIGVRFETIAGVRVLVGGPTGQHVRRLDMLALLQWTLPHLKGALPDFPERLTIISAGGNMWRGGLSAPQSLYLHSSLPLISENATSTLLHEVMHIGMGLSGEPGADWIVEGLAEYYSLELLRRSRSISKDRFDDAIKGLVDWGSSVRNLCAKQSTAATTARAVGVFAALHRELRRTGRTDPLDEVLRRLVAGPKKVSLANLRQIASDVHGADPRALSPKSLRGCDR